MKSNFNKTKRFAPKNNKKRNLGQSPSSRSHEPVKTKPIDVDAIKKAQEKLKEHEEESVGNDNQDEKNKDKKK